MVGWYFFFYGSWFVFDLFFVFVIDAMPQKKKKKKTLLDKERHFWTVFLLGHRLGPNLTWLDVVHGARGARWGGFGPWEKNPFNKRVKS